MKKEITVEDVVDVVMDIPLGQGRRSARNRQDFGDPETVKLHLRATVAGLNSEDFGVYFGEYQGNYIVGLMPVENYNIVGGLAYDSLAELKEEWELD